MSPLFNSKRTDGFVAGRRAKPQSPNHGKHDNIIIHMYTVALHYTVLADQNIPSRYTSGRESQERDVPVFAFSKALWIDFFLRTS